MFKKITVLFTFFLGLVFATSCASGGKKYTIVEIKTNQGNIYLWLYDDTPLHRDNFLKLIREGYYNGTRFHRVIKDFMIQGGDPNSKLDEMKKQWGLGGPDYSIPAEFVPTHYHKKGALAAARMGDDVNPQRASSGSQFYIVQGQVFNNQSLDFIQQQIAEAIGKPDFTFSQQARNDYSTIGGTPHLDMQYTVFGEVISGLEVVDKIASSPTNEFDQPLENITIQINVLELNARQLKKRYNYKVN